MNHRSASLPKSPLNTRSFLRRARARFAVSALVISAGALLFPDRSAQAAVRTWSGATSADWFGTAGFNGGIPVTGDSLVFGADGAAGQATIPPDTLTNSTTTSAFNIAGITFVAGAPAYTMTGNTFNLTAGITNNSTALETFSNTGGVSASAGYTFLLGGGITITNGLIGNFGATNATVTVNGAGKTLTLGSFNVDTSTTRQNTSVNGTGNVNITGGITAGVSTASLIYSGTGTLTLGGTSTLQGNGSSLSVSSGTLKLTGTEQAGVAVSGTGVFTETNTGVIGSAGGSFGSFNQGSSGTSTLSGANTYTGTTTVNAGTLLLDFSQATTPATATNIINNAANSSGLTLGGGTLSINGGATGSTNSQRFNGTTLTTLTASKLVFTQNGATSLSATLGGLTRNAQSTLDITLPTAGTVTTTSTTFASNGVLTSAASNGVAFATVNGGAAFASNTTGTIGAITPATGSAYGAAANVSVGTADAPASGAGANTLTFNGAADSVAFTGTNAITTGGILVTPSATGASTISGGTITAGGGKELTIFNYEPTASGSLTVSSVIADNATASALTIAGVGTTILSNANTFTGQTALLGGTLNLSNALALQNSTLQLNAGTALVFDQSVTGNAFTLGALAGAANVALVNNAGTPAAIALTVGGNNASTTYNGVLSGAGSLIKNGTGTLTFGMAQTYTGGLTINNGTIATGNTFNAFGTSGTLTLGQSGSANSATYNAAAFNNPITVNPGLSSNPGAALRQITPDTGSSFTIGGAISLVGGATLGFNLSSATYTLPGGVSGTGNVVTSGATGKGAGIVFNTASFNPIGTFQNLNPGNGAATFNSVIGTNVTGLIENTATSAIILTGANTFPGDTTITSGTVNLQNTLALQNSVVNFTGGAATFGTSGTVGLTAVTLGGLGGSGNVNLNNTLTTPTAVALTIGNSNVSNGSGTNPNTLNPTYAGVLSNTNGAASVTKVGTNTQTFTGVNTYTGATAVTGGTLNLASTGRALTGTTSIAVNNGGTLLFSQPNQVNTAAGITLGTAAPTTGVLSFAAGANQGTAATSTGGTVGTPNANGGTITTGGTAANGPTTAGLGALTLNNTATLTFGGASTTLVFGGFTPTNGSVLNITGYNNTTVLTPGSSGAGTDDRLVFLGDQSANLANFDFGSGPGIGVNEIALDGGFYEVTSAVPEPSTWMGGIACLGFVSYRLVRSRRQARREIGIAA